jgi:hypothetical protein
VRRILDILLGRTRPIRSKLERLFAISTAYLTLTANLRLTASGRAGVCFRPLESSEFQSLSQELERILKISGRETDTTIDAVEDEFGFQWVILQDSQFEDLVATIHLVSLTLEDKGFGEQLLAAVFKFLDREKPIFWIYNYKRGNFYPFVPRGGRQRDHATELRLHAAMQQELPQENEMERWYPLWGVPV